MEVTGERFVPFLEGHIKYEHLHRYALSRVLVKDKVVLDVASGEGYGAAALAQLAQSVIGIDIDSAVVEHARQTYHHYTNLQFLVGDCKALPLPDQSIDVVTSFETIEHHANHQEMLNEIKRVLKPDGLLILSSPNRTIYTEQNNYHNPFHVKELDYEELITLLETHFQYIQVYGQKVAEASFALLLQPAGLIQKLQTYSGEAELLVQQSPKLKDPLYFIALCSNNEANLSLDLNSLYSNWDNNGQNLVALPVPLEASETKLNHKVAELLDFNPHSSSAQEQSGAEPNQLKTELIAVSNYVEDLHNHIEQLNQQVASQSYLQEQLAALTRQLEASSQYIEDLHAHIYSRNTRIEELQHQNKIELNIQTNLAQELKASHSYIENLHQLTADQAAKLSRFEEEANLYQTPSPSSLGKETTQNNAQPAIENLGILEIENTSNPTSEQAQNQPEALLNQLQTQFNPAEQASNSQLLHYRNELRNLQQTRTVRISRAVGLVTKGLRQILHTPLEADIQGAVDLPLAQACLYGTIEVSGWASVRFGWVEQVEVLLGEVSLGVITHGTSRPDVIQARPLQIDMDCGYHGVVKYEVSQFSPGPQILKVRVISSRANVREFYQTVQLAPLKQENLVASAKISLNSVENEVSLIPDAEVELPENSSESSRALLDIEITKAENDLAKKKQTKLNLEKPLEIIADNRLVELQLDSHVSNIRVFVTSLGNYFMQEIAQYFIEALRANGFNVQLVIDQIPATVLPEHVWQVIVAPHDFYPLFLSEHCDSAQIAKINEKVYLLNVEQPGSRWFEIVAEVAKTVKGVWDINQLGLAEFNQRNIPVIHTPLGYSPSFEADTQVPKTVDLLFLGNSAPRRELFLSKNAAFFNRYRCQFILARFDRPNFDHTPGFYVRQHRNQLFKESRILINLHSSNRKYFEWHRVLNAIANHCLVITEPSLGFEPLIPGEHFIIAELEQIPEVCQFYLENERERLRLVNQAYKYIKEQLALEKICHSLFAKNLNQKV